MLAQKPQSGAERKAQAERLSSFIDAHTIELPQTPETAAVLDSLPAPDNPDTLAAALRAGATLRQAEDGQTLVLTGLSGGKSILLTPIQTPDGVMLCRQGVRIRAEIAPNLEQIGVTSMPSFPEFSRGSRSKTRRVSRIAESARAVRSRHAVLVRFRPSRVNRYNRRGECAARGAVLFA